MAVSASVLIHEKQRYLDAGFENFIPKPVDAGQICKSLANLLHVEYEYEEVESPLDISEINLPEDLHLRLKEAARFGQVTEMEEVLDELRQIGETERLLADQILRLTQNLDMDGILNILRRMEHE